MDKRLERFFEKAKEIGYIDKQLYKTHSVKNGLRNEDGTGVLVGLTKVSDVVGYCRECETKVDQQGQLFYRGIEINEIVDGARNKSRLGKANLFEETSFLIMFGYLPNREELEHFTRILHKKFHLPKDFLESKILRAPTKNLMNKLQQDVLTLYNYDKTPDDVSLEHIIDQGLHIVGKMPCLVAYNYQSKVHYFENESMYIHHVDEDLSFAENILQMIRPDQEFTDLEAHLLDIILVVHADHGGGPNSTFVNVVMSSTGTDIYSSFAGAIGSLKGPKHGGANIKVCQMMDDVIADIGYEASEAQIKEVCEKLLAGNYFDQRGLIYGMGHAVYTLSDPRSEVLKNGARELAKEKNLETEFDFYERFEKVAKEVIKEKKGINVCSNVDFYSGFVYEKMLNIPRDLYTPLFVCARSIGWLAHNIENQMYSGKIVRPATKYVGEICEYIDIEKRGN
ncbi:citrate synthase [Breznakia blatticola]|uniref:citrate synthase (unknown stereospecificity) n=1 Tax=Breznakia blatticola TaxID=1754012 RepID=A0A4R8A745_9FIRM|nr:citrate synthase [Breznakia blatticola]TDW26299.1 citrate synthase [Breznakia blatticola]